MVILFPICASRRMMVRTRSVIVGTVFYLHNLNFPGEKLNLVHVNMYILAVIEVSVPLLQWIITQESFLFVNDRTARRRHSCAPIAAIGKKCCLVTLSTCLDMCLQSLCAMFDGVIITDPTVLLDTASGMYCHNSAPCSVSLQTDFVQKLIATLHPTPRLHASLTCMCTHNFFLPFRTIPDSEVVVNPNAHNQALALHACSRNMLCATAHIEMGRTETPKWPAQQEKSIEKKQLWINSATWTKLWKSMKVL